MLSFPQEEGVSLELPGLGVGSEGGERDTVLLTSGVYLSYVRAVPRRCCLSPGELSSCEGIFLYGECSD